MGRKKHAEHVNHERWLVSYADLLTLLFAFFVVLFASSASDKKKAQKMAQAMQTAFAQHGIFDAHAATPPLAPGAGASQGPPQPLELPMEQPASGSGKSGNEQRQRFERAIAAAQAQHLLLLRHEPDGLTLSLQEAGFFESGSAEIRPQTLPVLARIATALPVGRLRVEGHTDNVPIHNGRYSSNWELSTARAAAIAQVLLIHSTTPPSDFSISGYGEFHPIASNATEAGRAENRRVDVVLLRTDSAASSAQALR